MIDFAGALRDRNVVPNSTWLKSDNTEMFVVLPDDDTAIRKLLDSFDNSFDNVPNADEPGWIRVARLPVEGRTFARVDIMFVPYLCGQIDKGIIKRIG